MAPIKRPTRSPERAGTRLWGAPEPADFKKSKIGQALGDAARIHLKNRRDIDRLLALEKLAIDIFSNGSSARAFATNPQEYMARAGFPNLKLDLNSQEVRLAMAMGDPQVRQAAAQGDTLGFVRAVMDQGLKDLTVGILGGVLVAELIVHASAVLTAVAVAVTNAVAVSKAVAVVEVKVSGDDGGTILTRQIDMLSRMAEDLGQPKLAKSVRSAKVRKILESYINLQMNTKRK
jgi:hypothetical protein